MLNLFGFKYIKTLSLLAVIFIAYFIFKNPAIESLVSGLGGYSYFGVFIAGMLFAFGFTAPFAAGFFIALTPPNLWAAGIVGGAGALFSDLLIFRFIRSSFKKEFRNIENTKAVKKVGSLIENYLGIKIKLYIIYVFAGILIASPLPDEIGVIMLAGLTKIKIKILSILSFLLNTIGILILLRL